MDTAIQLTTAQQFETERFLREIDNTYNREDLRRLAKILLEAWQMQRAATNWAIRQSLPPLPTYEPPH